MLTAYETNKLRLIKNMATRGKAHEVSREDKQWVLDITAREGASIPAPAAAMALKEGYIIPTSAVITQQTCTV